MDVHSPKIMTRACLRICLKIMANLSCRRFAQENPPFIDAFLLFQTKHLHLQWIFQAVDIASIPSVRKHSSKDHLNEEPQNQIPPDESKGPWRGHRVIFWPFFLRAGDHGDMIFEWKWAQNTVTTDVFCIWCLWNRGETHIFASCFVMMLEKHWQAPKKIQHLLRTSQDSVSPLEICVFFLCLCRFHEHVPMVPKGNHRKRSESGALPSGRSDQVELDSLSDSE